MYLKDNVCFRTVIKLEINNSRSVTRCCFGLLKLPTYVEDCDLIDWGLEKALAISPTNSMVLHIVGIFFERCKEVSLSLNIQH